MIYRLKIYVLYAYIYIKNETEIVKPLKKITTRLKLVILIKPKSLY